MNVHDIKVITGIRRSGKSKLLDSFHQYLLNIDCNIIHINHNLKEFEALLNKNGLYEFISQNYVDGKINYLLIDEIQIEYSGLITPPNLQNNTTHKLI